MVGLEALAVVCGPCVVGLEVVAVVCGLRSMPTPRQLHQAERDPNPKRPYRQADLRPEPVWMTPATGPRHHRLG